MEVVGQFGEPTHDSNGSRLINILCASNLLALNSRRGDTHPAWTRCRLSRSEQSIIEYVLVNSNTLSVHSDVHVHESDVSDHYLVYAVLSYLSLIHI